MGRAHTVHPSGFVGREPQTQLDGSPLPFQWKMAKKRAAGKAKIKIKSPADTKQPKSPKSTLGRGLQQPKRKSTPPAKEADGDGSNSSGGAGSAGGAKRARPAIDAKEPAPAFRMEVEADAERKDGGGEVCTTAPQSPDVEVVPDPPIQPDVKVVPDPPEQEKQPVPPEPKAKAEVPEPVPQKQVRFKPKVNVSPTTTFSVVTPGTVIGVSASVEFVVPIGCNLADPRSWATFMDDNMAVVNRLNASQLCQLAVAHDFTQPAPIQAGISAALIALSGKRMAIEIEVAHAQEKATTFAADAAKTAAPAPNLGDDRAALMANLILLSKMDVDKVAWESLGDRFFNMEDMTSVSTADRPPDVANSCLLQALGTVLEGSAAKARTDHMRTAGDAASHEELRDLVITEHRPNDAFRLTFQSFDNLDKVVAGHVNSKTLAAAFKAKCKELHPVGVDTQGKCDHVAMQSTSSVLNCFPELMRRLRGKEPKSSTELMKWFHLQFQGGVVPRGHAAIWGGLRRLQRTPPGREVPPQAKGWGGGGRRDRAGVGTASRRAPQAAQRPRRPLVQAGSGARAEVRPRAPATGGPRGVRGLHRSARRTARSTG